MVDPQDQVGGANDAQAVGDDGLRAGQLAQRWFYSIACSVTTSRALVTSSSSRITGVVASARASTSRCPPVLLELAASGVAMEIRV